MRYYIKSFYLCVFMLGVISCNQNHLLENSHEFKIDLLKDQLVNSDGKYVMVAAHRGDWRNAPENSLQAILNAIEMGVDIVEIDVRLSKDSVPVLLHDRSLDRTTNGSGNIEEWNLSQLKELFLKNGLGIPTRHKIPTLEEAMVIAKGKVMINLDKCYKNFKPVYDVLKKTQTTDHVIMKGKASKAEFETKYPNRSNDIFYMQILNLSVPSDFDRINYPIAYEFIFNRDTSQVLNDIPVLRDYSRAWVNSLWPELCAGFDDDTALMDPVGSYGQLVSMGFNIIQTDRPELLIGFLETNGYREN